MQAQMLPHRWHGQLTTVALVPELGFDFKQFKRLTRLLTCKLPIGHLGHSRFGTLQPDAAYFSARLLLTLTVLVSRGDSAAGGSACHNCVCMPRLSYRA